MCELSGGGVPTRCWIRIGHPYGPEDTTVHVRRASKSAVSEHHAPVLFLEVV